ncbi:hypothetical protein PanWU01x14_306720 [Parasponia andersonii]|uniref:Uncharacterized protein n=1 Tax=Parasponia andersonii TaxID=3476 RepID=A0A2P5ARR1_PARAD|nr:hypothetical protein PanWU01x14_306720 [Parasponia andersonii]
MEEEEDRDVFSSAVLQRYGICPLVRGRALKPALNMWVGCRLVTSFYENDVVFLPQLSLFVCFHHFYVSRPTGLVVLLFSSKSIG